MNKYKGVPVSKGVAIGPACIFKKREDNTPVNTLSKNSEAEKSEAEKKRIEEELIRFEKAIDETKIRMDKLVLDAGVRMGKDAAQIFLMHKLILDGSEFRNLSRLCIEDGNMSAEEAVRYVGEVMAGKFSEIDDDYISARADDIRDIAREMSDILKENIDSEDSGSDDYPYILIANKILPSDVATLDQDRVLAIVSVEGSPNSHASILAHMMDIPMIVSVPLDIDEIVEGTSVYVNADTGDVIVSPDVDFEEDMKRHSEPSRLELKNLIGKETLTSYGRRIDLYANIASIADLKKAMDNDAEGIGLFRTEFMYMDRDTPLEEDEQYVVYRKILSACPDKPVTIRTLDIGGDKKLSYLDVGEKRGIQVCLEHPELFKTQLRALARSSMYGKLRIMYPYVTSVEEVMAANSLLAEIKWKLLQDIGACSFKQGIMIETLEAVDIADKLTSHADFFSIGSNDLIRQIYGIDRETGDMSRVDDEYDKLFRAIHKVVVAAHKAGIKVNLCGEIAGNMEYTWDLLDTGLDGLSVAPSDILLMRDHIYRNC
ncbi:MAG: phosphoenolpyruvate--protein phosphotransferase [Lachnospiraceae bacterium]|nr:phosphoenolpyruvate--protein phosphotransferase [Lachnospiraceae bacterium]